MDRPNAYPGGPRPPSETTSRQVATNAMSPPNTNLSRAQRFESEKTRIQESCFGKLDESGQQAESYITHLRVEEDAMYPSAPPPSEHGAEHKKPRVIIVAVRSTGRVRLHKARENQGGSFSIGKTWNLEDLSSIESFNHLAPNSDPQRRINCQRAGDLGFVVTLVKPYYWQAVTSKERDFFIASLVKIFKKYTKGREPRLIGFDDKEKESMFGHLPPVNIPSMPPPTPGDNTPPQSAFSQYSRPESAFSRAMSNERYQAPPSAAPVSVLPVNRRNPSQDMASARGISTMSYASRTSIEHLADPDERRDNGRPPVPDALSVSRSQSRSDVRQPRPHSPPISLHSSPPRHIGSSKSRSKSPGMSRTSRGSSPPAPEPRQIVTPPRPTTRERWKPVNNSTSPEQDHVQSDRNVSDGSRVLADALPERKRPPLMPRATTRTHDSSDLKPSPLTTAPRSVSDNKLADKSVSIDSFYNKTSTAEIAKPAINHVRSPSSPLARQEPMSIRSSPQRQPHPLSPDPQSPEPDTERAGFRPGLGPMVKKKNAANQIRKAATAVNAFKARTPRAADALSIETSPSKDTDGRPAALRNASFDTNRPEILQSRGSETLSNMRRGDSNSRLDAGKNLDGAYDIVETPVDDPSVPQAKRRTRQQEKYLAQINVDPLMLNGADIDFQSCLSTYGWGDDLVEVEQLEHMQQDLQREIGRVEASSWLDHLEQKDDRVATVDKLLDRVIAECDELDGLLTIYSVELGTLNDDIAYIEAQSQGLQVQTANQKILQSELQSLVGTISIDSRQLQPLERGSFDTDFEEMEVTLAKLYTAITTLDPTTRAPSQTITRPEDSIDRTELATMNALREKCNTYREESSRFAQRLVGRLETRFETTLRRAIPALLTHDDPTWQLHTTSCNAARSELWKYSPMLLFTKEMASTSWHQLLNAYGDIGGPLYHDVFRSALKSHRKLMHVSTGEEAELLFTSVEKDVPEGAIAATRKLTMKRTQALARSFRSTSAEKATDSQRNDGRKMPYEVFNDMLSSWAPVFVLEQNFVVKLFHATSLESLDFVEVAKLQPPDARGEPIDLRMPMPLDPDRAVADQMTQLMQKMFEFWPAELKSLIDQATSEPLQAVGIMASIAVYSNPLRNKSQEYLLRTLGEASSRLQTTFHKFVDEQIKAIEDTKVKIKKRKGVIGFIRIFPHFSMAIENIFVTVTKESGLNTSVLEIRKLVDDAYERIAAAMWSSLKHIAKDTPATAGLANGSGIDAEDKETLNHEILLVENFNHFALELDVGEMANGTLDKLRSMALGEREEHLGQYLRRVIRRPLGKLLEFLESAEELVKQNTLSPAEIVAKPSHSRSAAKKALSSYDGREIRKGIEALRKRIEKHFSEGDADEAMAQKLVQLIFGECQNEYLSILERLVRLNKLVYAVDGEKGLEIEWSRDDVTAGFKKLI